MKKLGTISEPIEIQDDYNNHQANQLNREEHEANRQALYKAHLGSEFDVALAVIKTELHGSEKEKDRIIKNRITKFFSAQTKSINPENQHFRSRREPDYRSPQNFIVPNELIVYGIDFISNKQIRKRFEKFEIVLKCLDDSHCKIIFKNCFQCQAGLKQNVKDENAYKIKAENEDMELPKGWFELHPYNYLTFQRKIWCRYAMTNENDAEIERSNDHYMMMQAKKQFEKSIQSEVSELRYINIMMKFDFMNDNRLKKKIDRNRKKFRENGMMRNERMSRDGDSDSRSQISQKRRERQGFYSLKRINSPINSRQNEQRRNERSNLFDDISERSRNKPERPERYKRNIQMELDDLSMLSILSDNKSVKPKKVLERKLSISEKSVKVQEIEQKDSNLSFLLNDSSMQNGLMLQNMINLKLDSQMSFIEPKNEEEIEDRLSVMSEKNQSRLKKSFSQTPRVLIQNKIESKKKRTANVDIIILE